MIRLWLGIHLISVSSDLSGYVKRFMSISTLANITESIVCDSRIKFTDLVIDGLFTEILAADRTLGKTEVQFDEVNGQIEWSPISKMENKNKVVAAECTPVKRKSEELSSSPKKKKTCHEVITLDSDDEDTQSSTAPSASGNSSAGGPQPGWSLQAPIELSLSDDEDADTSDSIVDFSLPCSSRSRIQAAHTFQAFDPFRAHSDFASFSSFSNHYPHLPPLTASSQDDDDDDDIAIIE